MSGPRSRRVARRSPAALVVPVVVALALGALVTSLDDAATAAPRDRAHGRPVPVSSTQASTATPPATPPPSTPGPTPAVTPASSPSASAPPTVSPSPSPSASATPTAATSGPSAGPAVAGIATYYTAAGPAGACMPLTFPADGYTAAAGPALFDDGRGCGSWVEVTGARGTVLVKIDNLCPECEEGHLDLSTEAFAAVDDPAKGIVPIESRVVRNPAVTGGLAFKVKDGSSAWWLGLHVDNAGNAVAGVEVADGDGAFRPLTRQQWGWTLESSPGAGPYRVRVTDVHGQSTVATGITLSPGVLQTTTARLY